MTNWLTTLSKEPLIHFLLMGVGLFVFFNAVGNNSWDTQDPSVIKVDENSLVAFMLFRAKSLDNENFRFHLANMQKVERQQLIDDYVREEVLYREAKSMKLDTDDYIIRRRLVQKMNFITREISLKLISPSNEELLEYFNVNRKDYFVEPQITFTHVFFDIEKHGRKQAYDKAKQQQKSFLKNPITFEKSIQYGDRFSFHLNYVEKTPDFIYRHFGDQLVNSVFDLTTPVNQWFGPVSSAYGEHLILISQREAGHFPAFEKVQTKVSEDYQLNNIDKMQNKAIQTVIENYQIEVNYPIKK